MIFPMFDSYYFFVCVEGSRAARAHGVHVVSSAANLCTPLGMATNQQNFYVSDDVVAGVAGAAGADDSLVSAAASAFGGAADAGFP